MNTNINGLIEQWNDIRSYSICFIENLDDSYLDLKLPRKGLDTLRKHFEEMFLIQKDFIDSIEKSSMQFSGISDLKISGKLSKKIILNNMNSLDKELNFILESTSLDKKIIWFGECKSLSYHLSAMIAHETMHIGQIIAFCYSQNINIPAYIINSWALSG